MLANVTLTTKLNQVEEDFVFVDAGLKFEGKIKRKGTPLASSKVSVGNELDVIVKDLELSAHFLGDSRATSMHKAVLELPNTQTT